MKNKRITLILLAITITSAVVAMVIVRRKGKVKKYDLQEDAKRYANGYILKSDIVLEQELVY